MTGAVARLAHLVAVRAQKDTRFARVLDALLTAPTAPQGSLERTAARKLIGSAVGTQTCFPAWQFDSGDSLDGRLVAAARASPQDGDRGRRE